MGYETPRLPNPCQHPPNCQLVTDVLIFSGLPSRLSPHSFRVTAITDLLTQGIPLEDVQYLAAEKSDAEHRGADFDLTYLISAMTRIPDPAYWQAVANGINAENQKATIFLKHNPSIGIAREAILRDLLVKQTPEPFRVATGFIYEYGTVPWSSKQCDVLVYDPTTSQPHYAIGGLSVVPRKAARVVVEVKTTLEKETFTQIMGVWKKLHESVGKTQWIPPPTLAFAYDGMTFPTCLDYICNELRESSQGLPECLAVHEHNYIIVRSGYRLAVNVDIPHRHRPATYHLAVNFGAADKSDGRASAAFFDFYHYLLEQRQVYEPQLKWWFNQVALPDSAMVKIADDGSLSYGHIVSP
jgi:hypothetical protein